jgi:hypothetical protein
LFVGIMSNGDDSGISRKKVLNGIVKVKKSQNSTLHAFLGISPQFEDRPQSKIVVLKLPKKNETFVVTLKLPRRSGSTSVETIPTLQKAAPASGVHTFFMSRKQKAALDAQKKPSPTLGATVVSPRPLHPFFSRRTPLKRTASAGPATQGEKCAVAKRTKSEISRPPSAPLTRGEPVSYNSDTWSSPWPKFAHVRGLDNEQTMPVARPRKQKRKVHHLQDGKFILKRDLHCSPGKLHKCTRIVMSGSEVKWLATQNVTSHILEPLLNGCGTPSAFDNYTCEQQTWCAKYAPTLTSAVVTCNRNGENVVDWLRKKIEVLKKAPPPVPVKRKPPRKDDLDGFIVGDSTSDEQQSPAADPVSDFLVLCGPPGTGKTSSVYAAGKELDAYVFEVNAGQRRSGRDLIALLDGMGQSHLVHSSGGGKLNRQDSIVLLEEVDVLYDEDNAFWAGLERVAAVSRRPIVLTCTDPLLLPTSITDGGSSTFLQFSPAPTSVQVGTLWLLGLSEGHLLDKLVLEKLVQKNKWDLRSSINNLQFWCQMGVGGRRSGLDWTLTRDERLQLNLVDARVISDGTFVDVSLDPPDIFYNYSDNNQDANMSLMEWSFACDLLSDVDILATNTHSSFSHGWNRNEDLLSGIHATSEAPLREEPLPFELQMYPYLLDRIGQRPSPPPPNAMDVITLREALFASLDGGISFDPIDAVPLHILATETVPYTRGIARADRRREQDRLLQQQELEVDGRSSRRSYRAMTGLEPARPMYLEGDLDEILNTAPSSWGQIWHCMSLSPLSHRTPPYQ